TFLVGMTRQSPQPDCDRARTTTGQSVEFGIHTGPFEDLDPFVRARDRPVAAEQRRHESREARISHPTSEASDMRAYTGHLGHHDDGWTLAGDINLLGNAIERDVAHREVVEWIIDLHIAARHVASFQSSYSGPRTT